MFFSSNSANCLSFYHRHFSYLFLLLEPFAMITNHSAAIWWWWEKSFFYFPQKRICFYAVVLVVLFPKLNHTRKKEEARIYRIFFLHLLFSKPPTSSSVRKKDYPGSIPYVATIIILFSLERKKKDEKAYQHFSSPLPLSSSSWSELAGVLPFSFSRPKKGTSKKTRANSLFASQKIYNNPICFVSWIFFGC